MPAATEAAVHRDGEALRFSGALVRAAVPALWRAAQPQAAGARRIDIGAVTRIDSAGLALLSALAETAARGAAIDVIGEPPGLADLRAAYRLDTALGFAS
ncbi:STAS domain-containing protein [Luteimonas terricola]|uniref:STAS domain-containing protein n=1 Tax=Luteimonas terricola TaxID=645597 RepID=UPI001048408D|nr:STAS domain-containing protein [Luteimonas terricola]